MIGVEELTIKEIHDTYASYALTPSELVHGYFQRIDDLDRSGPRLNAINTINDHALAVAEIWDRRLRDEGTPRHPLAGIPIVLKDNIETAGLRTTFGSICGRDYVPVHDAALVRRLRDAGAIIIAKTAMADFGASWYSASSLSGLTRNPYALDHDSGGSSSGTAVAVAANLCTAGVGGDTGGSIRLPAAFCNVVGLRPTTSLISTAGIAPLVARQDTAGPIARTVADAATLFRAMVDPARLDPTNLATASTQAHGRIGYLEQLVDRSGAPESSGVSRVVLEALEHLRTERFDVPVVEISDLARLLRDSSLYLLESKADLDAFIVARLGPRVRGVADIYRERRFHPALDLFQAISTSSPDELGASALRHALRARATLTSTVVRLLEDNRLDALCYPTVQVRPPTHEEVVARRWASLEYPTNTVLASQAGLPAISVPVGFTSDGFAVGLEITGRPFSEETLIALAASVERAIGARRSPQFGLV